MGDREIAAYLGYFPAPGRGYLYPRNFDRNPELGFDHLKALFPKLLAWHRWFFESRNENGVIVVNHPWESGRDDAPDWDEAMENIDTSDVGEYTRNDTSHVDPHMRPNQTDYDRFMAIV